MQAQVSELKRTAVVLEARIVILEKKLEELTKQEPKRETLRLNKNDDRTRTS